MAYSSGGMGNPFGFTITPWVKRLLIANVVVFLITLALGGLVPYLAFTPAEVLRQPWTPLTYLFVHAGPFHLFFNMLGLLFFGPPLEERWGSADFIKFYLVAGLGGAALSLIFPHTPIVGASGAIYGILLAYATYWPDNPIYIWGILPVKAKWLVGFLIAMSVFSAVTGGGNGVAHLAHLGGAAGAFLYLRSPWGPSAWGPHRKTPKRKRPAAIAVEDMPRELTVSRPKRRAVSAVDEVVILDEVDRILDKISKHGLGALTDEERRVLDQASRRNRTN